MIINEMSGKTVLGQSLGMNNCHFLIAKCLKLPAIFSKVTRTNIRAILKMTEDNPLIISKINLQFSFLPKNHNHIPFDSFIIFQRSSLDRQIFVKTAIFCLQTSCFHSFSSSSTNKRYIFLAFFHSLPSLPSDYMMRNAICIYYIGNESRNLCFCHIPQPMIFLRYIFFRSSLINCVVVLKYSGNKSFKSLRDDFLLLLLLLAFSLYF